jgi:hypothetical protein
MTDLTYCVLDMSLPAIMTGGGNAWFYDGKKWNWIVSGDVYHNGREIGEAAFRAKFPDLPPLPES